MPHKVEISNRTFEKLKEYCSFNDLKIGQYADKLIYDGLMIEMYGDVPFTNYKKVQSAPVTEIVEPQPMSQPDGSSKVLLSDEIIPIPKEIIEKFPPEKFKEEYTQEPGPITEELKKIYEDFVWVERTARAHEKENEEAKAFKRSIEEAIREGEEKLRQAGVPTKVANKITKRRLK